MVTKTFYAGNGLNGRIDLSDWNGHYMVPGMPDRQAHFKSLHNFNIKEKDVLICSYPKSGYHWVWEITTLLIQNRTDITKKMAASFILDFAFLKKIRDLPSPRVFGWHSPFEYISDSFKQSKCKIINVIRDPRSVAVSAYHFYSKLKDVRWEGDWNGFLDLFVNGKVPFNDWFTYVQSWEDMRRLNTYDIPIFIVHYEDLLKDPVSEIRRLAQFLQVDTSESLIQGIVDATSFAKMKAVKDDVQRGSFISTKFENNDFILFNKGDINDWKNYFTMKQNEDFEKLYAEKMESYDLKLKSMISPTSVQTGCVEISNTKPML